MVLNDNNGLLLCVILYIAFNSFMAVQRLENHLSFPTHERGGSLDPVLTHIPHSNILCQQLGMVGTLDHHAVLTGIKLDIAR